MSLWTPDTIVRIDREHGSSRYSARITKYHLAEFFSWPYGNLSQEIPVDTWDFAIAAWKAATFPLPSFIRQRPDLRSITPRLTKNEYKLYFDVVVPLRHNQLHNRTVTNRRWRDWQAESGSCRDRYISLCEPDGNHSAILTTSIVRIPAAHWQLPEPVAARSPHLAATAIRYMEILAYHLNEEAGPVVAALLAF